MSHLETDVDALRAIEEYREGIHVERRCDLF